MPSTFVRFFLENSVDVRQDSFSFLLDIFFRANTFSKKRQTVEAADVHRRYIPFDARMASARTQASFRVNFSAYLAPGYYRSEDDQHPGDVRTSAGDVLVAFVRSFPSPSVTERGEARWNGFPETTNGSDFFVAACAMMKLDVAATQEAQSCLSPEDRERCRLGQIVENPLRRLAGPSVVARCDVADEDTIDLLKRQLKEGMSAADVEELQEKAQRRFLVEQQRGGPEGQGLTSDEFDRYWRAVQGAKAYQAQTEAPIRSFEEMVPRHADRQLLALIADVKTNFLLVEGQLRTASQALRRMLRRGDDIVGAAAYAHNAVCYVQPRITGNGRTARALCNAFLVFAGLRPIVACEEYYEAVERDMLATPRGDALKNWKQSVGHVARFIVQFQGFKPCDACGRRECEERCSQCKRVCYCSAECQTADWKAGHKLFCRSIKGEAASVLARLADRQMTEAIKIYSLSARK